MTSLPLAGRYGGDCLTDTGSDRPEDQEAVFEEFRQVGRQTRSRGTGLGLALSRKFMSSTAVGSGSRAK